MMQGVLVIVALWSYETMLNEPAQMFTKLQNVEQLHAEIRLVKGVDIST